MDQQAREQAFFSALTTEHFVMQSVASTTVSESSARASLYLMSLSSSLVAIGFAAQSAEILGPFAAVVLSVVFVLGIFTTVRLVDTGVENILAQRTIARIRRRYAELTPDARTVFGPPTKDISREALSMIGARPGRFLLLFTMASTIGAVNAVVGATGVALVIVALAGVGLAGVAILIGVAAGVALLWLVVAYQRLRYAAMDAADRARWSESEEVRE